MPLAVLFCLTDASGGGPVLIGATADGIIFDIDPVSGGLSNARDIGRDHVTGLAFSAVGALYAQTGAFGTGAQNLYSLDAVGGDANLVRHFPDIDFVDFDLEFNSRTSTLLTLSQLDGTLISIEPTSGGATKTSTAIGNSGPLACNAIGRAFAVITGQDFFINPHPHGADRIVELNPVTGTILSNWVLDVDMTFASSTFIGDTLIILDQPFGEAGTLYAFDPAAGSLSMIGQIVSDERIVALAYIPEPATWALFGAVMIAATRLQPIRLVTAELSPRSICASTEN